MKCYWENRDNLLQMTNIYDIIGQIIDFAKDIKRDSG